MEVVPYTEGFKQQMVKRMLGPPAVTGERPVQEGGRGAADAIEVAA
jgi:hypothetical protein